MAAQLAAAPAQAPADADAPVQISKSDARNVATYRKAKAKGVALQIVSDA